MKLAHVAVLGMARVRTLDSGSIGYHLPGLLPDHLRLVHDEYRVPIALGHLSPVGAWQYENLGMEFARLGKHLAAIIVESPDYLASQLDMRRLILAYRDVVGFVHNDIGRLKHRITEKQIIANVLLGDILALLFVGRHPLQPA